MPPFEDISVKLLPSIVTEVTNIEKPSIKGIVNEEDLVEKVSAIRLQETKDASSIGNEGDFVIEPRSGFKFPLHLSPLGYTEGFTQDSSPQVLAGVGIRSVNIIKLSLLKIYAFGFYLKPECMRKELGSKYGGVPPQELKLKTSFYEDLLRHELDMSVRLIVHHKRVRIGLVKSWGSVHGHYLQLRFLSGVLRHLHWGPSRLLESKARDRSKIRADAQ